MSICELNNRKLKNSDPPLKQYIKDTQDASIPTWKRFDRGSKIDEEVKNSNCICPVPIKERQNVNNDGKI